MAEYTYPSASGAAPAEPSAVPTRTGYEFAGWKTSEDGGADFDFSAALTADTTVYASWERTAPMTAATYTFEAEDTDLTGKTGPSFSGSASEEGMIITDATGATGASNDRYVGYLYNNGLSLEFRIASDMAVRDATIVLRLSGEYAAMSYDSTEFQVLVNGQPQTFSEISKDPTAAGVDVLPFEDHTISVNVPLVEGANLIQLKVNNTKATDGTTFKAQAPLVDCLKITTTAVLTWDAYLGLPADNYDKEA